jgi:hypothetical protein
MATHSPHDLLRLWRLEQLPLDMATGHILQNLVTIQEAIDAIQRDLAMPRTHISDPSAPQTTSKSTTRRQGKKTKL